MITQIIKPLQDRQPGDKIGYATITKRKEYETYIALYSQDEGTGS